MKIRSGRFLVFFVCAFLLLAGCGGADTPNNNAPGDDATNGSQDSDTIGNNPDTPAISRGSGTPAADPIAVVGSFPNQVGLFDVSGFGGTRPRDPSDPVRIYRPNANAGLPLILAFPGTGNTTEEILWALRVSGDGAATDSIEPAIFVALPNSNQPSDWDHDGGGVYFNTTDHDPNSNTDLQLVRQAIKEASRAYAIDPTRVYAIGFSNGAFMAIHVAMTLPRRIAGFAERSGGWARCLPDGFKAGSVFTSSSTVCSAILSSASASDYACGSNPAQPFTALPGGSDRVPGYLSHDNQDSSVSVYYTCDLYQQMLNAGFAVELDIRQLDPDSGGQHGVPEDFIINAWNFLRTKSL